MIVAIEGIDASGKETQVNRLRQWAIKYKEEMGLHEVGVQDFPDYKTASGRRIGGLLRGEWSVVTGELGDKEITKALVLQSLMLTNRLEHAKKLKSFEGDPCSLLLLDRYHASGWVYGRSDGLSVHWLEDVHWLLPEPDLWILVDISVEESFRRRPERQDYYEKDRHKLEQVRELYLNLFKERRSSKGAHWIVVDGTGSVDDVHLRVLDPVRDWLKER
jgi:dTMP kinase